MATGAALASYGAFAMFAVVASVTPGPNNVMLTSIGASAGVRPGLPALFGVSLGFGAMVFLVAAGLGGFIAANPGLLTALQVGGVAVLLWMCWQIATAPVADAAGSVAPPAAPVGFFGAAAFQWVNPKAWLTAISATTTYFSAEQGAIAQALVFAAVFVLAAAPSCLIWLAFGALARRFLAARPRVARGFNIAMAALLASSIAVMVG